MIGYLDTPYSQLEAMISNHNEGTSGEEILKAIDHFLSISIQNPAIKHHQSHINNLLGALLVSEHVDGEALIAYAYSESNDIEVEEYLEKYADEEFSQERIDEIENRYSGHLREHTLSIIADYHHNKLDEIRPKYIDNTVE